MTATHGVTHVQPSLLNLSAYINQNLDQDLPLSALARRAGLSPFHFHRKFSTYFGESLHQHIKRLRLERAAYALRYGTLPVHVIAKEAGYKTVSAFSHAFSGFAGESPTRYRARGVDPSPPDELDALDGAGALRPSWIGELAPQGFAFLRAEGSGRGPQPTVGETIDEVLDIIQPTDPSPVFRIDAPAERAATTRAGDVEIIAATSDVYGIAENGSFRIDVGVDAAQVPPDRSDHLAEQTLPGGRYARFDLFCHSSELLERCYRVSRDALRGVSETARASLYFVRFLASPARAEAPDGPRSYRFFMPLAE